MDAAADPDGEIDTTGPEEAGAPGDDDAPGEAGGFVTFAPVQACARTTVTSAIDLRRDRADPPVNP